MTSLSPSRAKQSHILGYCYLLHFDKRLVGVPVSPDNKVQYAQHYLGWAKDPVTRLAEHAAGQGARLLQVAQDAGITWELVYIWPEVDRYFERRLKGRGSRGRLCPVCLGKPLEVELLRLFTPAAVRVVS